MKIQVLMENTTERTDIISEHGLSFYVETEKHKLLFDMGQTDGFAENAARMGVDLSQVDIAILSHGHYDHGGGLGRFLELNKKAHVYMSRYAMEPHFSGERYIGLNTDLVGNERFVLAGDVLKIDDELCLYSCNMRDRSYAADSFGLKMRRKEMLVPDDFRHEQYLLIQEGTKRVLLSGCSHKGILNIMEWFNPDLLIGGFHFMKLDAEGEGKAVLKNAADILNRYHTQYYTCHCTGRQQFEYLKRIMGEKVEYLSAGMEIWV